MDQDAERQQEELETSLQGVVTMVGRCANVVSALCCAAQFSIVPPGFIKTESQCFFVLV